MDHKILSQLNLESVFQDSDSNANANDLSIKYEWNNSKTRGQNQRPNRFEFNECYSHDSDN